MTLVAPAPGTAGPAVRAVPGAGRTAGHRAVAEVVAEARGGTTRCATVRSDPPLTFRTTPAGLMWVGTAAGPVGGDELSLGVRLGPRARLRIGSVAACLVLPGPHGEPSSLRIDVELGDGASLVWWPEPTIVAAGADHRGAIGIRLAGAADLVWVDETVLGRHGEQPGRASSRLAVDGPGGPVVRTGFEVGAPGWDGPAGLAGCRSLAQVLLVGGPAREWQRAGAECDRFGSARIGSSVLGDGSLLVTVVAPGALDGRRAVAEVVARATTGVPGADDQV